MTRLGLRKKPPLTLREQHQILIDKYSRYTPDERQEIRRRAAAMFPPTEQEIAEGDAAWAGFQKGRSQRP
jgi:hypothetical protein